MKNVKQKDNTGCGIAIVAAVAEISYDSALKIVHPNYLKKKKFWTNWQQLTKALDKLGIVYTKKKRIKTDAKTIAGIAKNNKEMIIASVAEKRGQKNWHFVLFTKNGKLFDPFFGKSIDPSVWTVVRSIMVVEN